jgi:hypothetical protein
MPAGLPTTEVVGAVAAVVAVVAEVVGVACSPRDAASIASPEGAVLPPSTCVFTTAAAEPATKIPAIEIIIEIRVFIVGPVRSRPPCAVPYHKVRRCSPRDGLRISKIWPRTASALSELVTMTP